MKRILIMVLLLLVPGKINALEINSNNAILYNLTNDTIIYEQNSDETTKIASLTKIMTTIVAIENIPNIEQKVTLTSDMFYNLVGASKAGFSIGDVVTYEDLLYGTMLPSGADATNALSILIAGSEEAFTVLMNEKAKELGLINTNFENASGLDTSNNYSTVKEVSIFLKYALENETFKQIYQTREYTTTSGLDLKSSMNTYQSLLNINTDVILGSKTGYTGLAGLCLSSITTYNDISYMLVTTNAPVNMTGSNVLDAINIYDYYFENYQYSKLIEKEDVLVTLTYNDKSYNVLSEDSLYYYTLSTNEVRHEYIGVTQLSKEYKKGDKIGEYITYYDDEIINIIDIYMPINIIDYIPILFGLGIILGVVVIIRRKK